MTFLYDPFGRRIEKISPTATSIFVYDGDNLVETANASGGEVAKYAQGQNIDEPLAMDRSGTIDYYEQDGLGSVTSLTASNGSVAQSYTYDSFGNQTASSGSLTNFFRYTGREFDTETNLYYYRARYYDPTIGRFSSEDPMRFSAGVNPYGYTVNSPVNLSDPSGLCPEQKKCAPSGNAPPPGFYAQLGQDRGNWFVNYNFWSLPAFHRGWFLDAQVQYGGSQAYANYVFGVYMAAAGYSLSTTLTAANAYGGLFSHYPSNTTFDPQYPHIPSANVANITRGFNDERNGTLCNPY